MDQLCVMLTMPPLCEGVQTGHAEPPPHTSQVSLCVQPQGLCPCCVGLSPYKATISGEQENTRASVGT